MQFSPLTNFRNLKYFITNIELENYNTNCSRLFGKILKMCVIIRSSSDIDCHPVSSLVVDSSDEGFFLLMVRGNLLIEIFYWWPNLLGTTVRLSDQGQVELHCTLSINTARSLWNSLFDETILCEDDFCSLLHEAEAGCNIRKKAGNVLIKII